jgi:hypothetical protein
MAQFFCEMVEDANPVYFDEGTRARLAEGDGRRHRC